MWIASAPGKVMVAGEYAVLSGAHALVLAVDARASARLAPIGSPTPAPTVRGLRPLPSGSSGASAPGRTPFGAMGDGSPAAHAGSPAKSTLPPEVLLTQREAERSLGASPMELTIDTRALREGDRKLGLGSSAAGAAAAAAAVFASAGVDPASAREKIFRAALAGHHAVAPHGSGADVAASSFGGMLRYRRQGDDVQIAARAMPRSVRALLVWTGSPVRTSELVDRVRALAARDARAHASAIDAIADAAVALDRAIDADDAAAILAATRAHHDAMGALGEKADAPIVTPALARLAELARDFGAASKPSGAGGGDVAILFAPPDLDIAALGAALAESELRLLSFALGAEGARLERDGSAETSRPGDLGRERAQPADGGGSKGRADS